MAKRAKRSVSDEGGSVTSILHLLAQKMVEINSEIESDIQLLYSEATLNIYI